jgi:hypothetical protein
MERLVCEMLGQMLMYEDSISLAHLKSRWVQGLKSIYEPKQVMIQTVVASWIFVAKKLGVELQPWL